MNFYNSAISPQVDACNCYLLLSFTTTATINTCVCQASRIAYGAQKEFRRVVTLVGEVFEKSGTMSGGGKKVQRGMMGTAIQESISEDAIKKAENELNNLVDKLNMLREKMSDAKRHYRSMEEAKSRLEMELAKAKKEVCKRAVFCLPSSWLCLEPWSDYFISYIFSFEIG